MLNNGVLKANLLNLDLIEKYGSDCRFLREISLQLKVHKHPNVLSIYKVYDFENSIFVVMDYFPEGDLFATIVDKQRYKDDPFLVKSVFIQMVDAINYCHSKNVYHCDLKPENVLVANNGTRVVLADFGLALQERYIDSNISCGSSYYMAPERIQNFSQGFNTMESHSIHLDRLLDPSNHRDEYVHHGNVKFPTSSGDVWSLAIILINLICIRNPWFKASFHDPTFKAFVQNPKILMKILPISIEVYNIMSSYLHMNPWDRGELFQFRNDILHCHRLTETGPLSINSSLNSLDVITTESQMTFDLDKLTSCPVPVDHVALQRKRSRENIIESIEVENNYIPESNKNDPLNNDALPIDHTPHSRDCKGCPECDFNLDFNQRFGGGNESGTSLMTLSTSYSNYSSVTNVSNESKLSSFNEHQIQLENEKRKAQAAERDYKLQEQQLLHNERKRLRDLHRQQKQQYLLQQQQLQQQQKQQQQQQQQQSGTLFSKLFKHHHHTSPAASPAASGRAYPQPGMNNHPIQIVPSAAPPVQVYQPPQQQQQQPPQHAEVPVIAPEFKQFFPMPGMGHHSKPIISQAENRRKKFVTKKRQRKATTSSAIATGNPTIVTDRLAAEQAQMSQPQSEISIDSMATISSSTVDPINEIDSADEEGDIQGMQRRLGEVSIEPKPFN